VDDSKIRKLQNGIPTIYEPWLKEMLSLSRERIEFANISSASISESDVVFITVGTPSLDSGLPDLKNVLLAAGWIGQNLGKSFTVVVNKSTVPIGSGNWVESLIRDAFEARNGEKCNGRFAVASNPEFLREGSALFDTFYPDRVVVGSDNHQALDVLYNLYKPILEQTFNSPIFIPRPESLGAVPFITTNLSSAELIKYAANSFLSLKVSFINEIAQLSEKVGSDITQVAKGIGLDARIGTRFLQAGIGWGGSCFGKDTAALVSTGLEYGITMPIVKAARDINYRQRERIVEKLLHELKILKGRTIGILGLAFKPNTDDIRDAPALDIASRLLERGVKVKAHDPVAIERASSEHPNLDIAYFDNPEEVSIESDALILVTDWPVYRELSWKKIANQMRTPIILDGRNFLDKESLEKAGFKYLGIGR
jgi:UDPglucose 6-dehydrogenase